MEEIKKEKYPTRRKREKKTSYYNTIFHTIGFIAILTFVFTVETEQFIKMMLIGAILLEMFLLWIYCLISIIKNDFKKDVNKIVWLILIFIIPIIFIIYLDLEHKLILNENS